jgi:hypothetical protein
MICISKLNIALTAGLFILSYRTVGAQEADYRTLTTHELSEIQEALIDNLRSYPGNSKIVGKTGAAYEAINQLTRNFISLIAINQCRLIEKICIYDGFNFGGECLPKESLVQCSVRLGGDLGQHKFANFDVDNSSCASRIKIDKLTSVGEASDNDIVWAKLLIDEVFKKDKQKIIDNWSFIDVGVFDKEIVIDTLAIDVDDDYRNVTAIINNGGSRLISFEFEQDNGHETYDFYEVVQDRR